MNKKIALTAVLLCFTLWFPDNRLYAQPVISGAGATFPSPLYFKWIDEFGKKVPSRITYRETGSSEGIRMLLAMEADFGATDVCLPENKMRQKPVALLYVPTCIGAVAIIYNLENNPEIRLTPSLLADIFMGRITSWADQRIKDINPSVNIRPSGITVIHRSEGSGTTFLLSDYLSLASIDWKNEIGAGLMINWRVGVGVQENSGVTGLVKKIPGSIGYVSLNYAMKNRIPAAAVQNAEGNFITPSVASVSAAAKGKMGNIRQRLINSRGRHSYPICGFTYIVVFREQYYRGYSEEHARALVDFIRWCIHEGQRYAEPLFYAPLPDELRPYLNKLIDSVTYRGKPLS